MTLNATDVQALPFIPKRRPEPVKVWCSDVARTDKQKFENCETRKVTEAARNNNRKQNNRTQTEKNDGGT